MMTGRRQIVLVAGLLALSLTVSAQVKDRLEVQLQAAIKQELVDGDPKGAIEQFKKISQSSNPEVAAEALVHLAACYDQLGQAEARSTYERVVREYPGQKNAVAAARAWLDAHGSTVTGQGGIKNEQVWAGPGVDIEGRVSADGRHLAFADWTNGSANLAVRDLRTGENRILTRGSTYDAFAENALPSPDGKLIAYRWGETDTNSTIRVIRSNGTDMRVLAHDRHEHYLVAWSPDGKYLAATRADRGNASQIVLISTADGSVKQLKSMAWPAPDLGGFSPDGRFLVYAVDKNDKAGDGGVYVIATDASQEVPLVRGAASFSNPIWSPDGSRVLFTSDRSEAESLWSIRVVDGKPAESQPELLRSNVGNIWVRGFARDGSLYYATREVQTEAYLADFDPATLAVGKPLLVSDRFVGRNASPELSPDGKYVAFVRRRAAPGEGSVAVRSLASGEERILTAVRPAYGARTLQWFPDGRSLLVQDAAGNQKKRVRQVNVGSGEARVLFEGPWRLWTTALSVDGTTLFYSVKEDGPSESGTLQLMKRALETGVETELYRTQSSPGIGFFGLSVSPDGTQLAFAVNLDYNQRAVMTIPAAGGPAREIRRFNYDGRETPLPQGPMTWTKDGRRLLVTVEGDQNNAQLAALAVEGGQITLLGLRMPTIPTRSLSADGRRIAFTGSTSKRELWVFRNLLSQPAK